jgi:hypothetical protein
MDKPVMADARPETPSFGKRSTMRGPEMFTVLISEATLQVFRIIKRSSEETWVP